MIMQLAIYLVILVVLWVLNIIITIPLRGTDGNDHVYFKKAVDNGNALFYDLGGLVLIAISWYIFSPVRWLVLAGYALYSAWGIYVTISGLIVILITKLKDKGNPFNVSILWASNIIELCGSLLVLYPTAHYLFGWF